MPIQFLTEEAIAALSFEDALHQLEAVVQMLEDGSLPLDDAVKIFEQGNKLHQRCEQKLKAAKINVEQIIQASQDQPVTFESFNRVCA